MSNTNLFRFAGWSAILSILFSFGMFALLGDGRGGAFMVVSIIATLFSLVTLYGVCVFHRPQAPALSLAMLVCAVVGMILENLGSGPDTPMGMATNVIYGTTFLLVGYLGYGNAQMPRWLAISAYVVGFSSLVTAVASALGQISVTSAVPMVLFLAWIAWSIGIWRFFTASKTITATV
ncbi:MAG: hypothetical protein IT314_01515 [Anaerolineales bacterium]|nr:hypothetical protein [Anaerolineales bacterium]